MSNMAVFVLLKISWGVEATASSRSRQKPRRNAGSFLEITNTDEKWSVLSMRTEELTLSSNNNNKVWVLFNTLKNPGGSGKPTTIKFFWCYGGHWSSLDPPWILTGGCCLSITRLCVRLQQLRQPQDFTVTVESIWIQTPAQKMKQPQQFLASSDYFAEIKMVLQPGQHLFLSIETRGNLEHRWWSLTYMHSGSLYYKNAYYFHCMVWTMFNITSSWMFLF